MQAGLPKNCDGSTLTMNNVRIGLIQQSASEDRELNRERGLEGVRKAAAEGANVVCFAELAFDPFWPQIPATPERVAMAEPVPGPTTKMYSALAKELGVVIVLNVFECDRDKTFDTSPVIDVDGSILGTTRMIHITDYDWFHEQGYYTPGDHGVPVYDTEFGRLGVAICYDRHYPEYMRTLGLAGAEIVFIPQAGTVGEWPEGLFEAEMRVAAFQNGYFTALCNRVGVEPEVTFAGGSFVAEPSGRVIARAKAGEEDLLLCDIDLSSIAESHAKKLFLRDRRPELYSDWL